MTVSRVGAIFSGSIGVLTLVVLWRGAGTIRKRNQQLAANTEQLRQQTVSINEHTQQLDYHARELQDHGNLIESLGNLMFALNPDHDPARGRLDERKLPFAIDRFRSLVDKRGKT